jgi:hypothetical protein
MLCAPVLVIGGAEGIGSRVHVLRAHTCFRRYRGRQVPFSCCANPGSCSAVPRASGPIFMFCAPGLVFGGTEGVGSRFHVLRPNSFSMVPRALCPVFMFCAPEFVFGGSEASGPVFTSCAPGFMFCTPGLVFGGTEGVGFLFHVLPSWTLFRQYRGRRVPFSYFALPNSFSAVPRSYGSFFLFCAPGLIFDGTVGVLSRILVLRSRTRFWLYRWRLVSFHVFRARTRYRRYRGRRAPFSFFALLDLFSAVPRASSLVFMFFAPGLVFGGNEFVGSRFIFCAPGLVFDSTEGVGSRFPVFCAWTRFRL